MPGPGSVSFRDASFRAAVFPAGLANLGRPTRKFPNYRALRSLPSSSAVLPRYRLGIERNGDSNGTDENRNIDETRINDSRARQFSTRGFSVGGCSRARARRERLAESLDVSSHIFLSTVIVSHVKLDCRVIVFSGIHFIKRPVSLN